MRRLFRTLAMLVLVVTACGEGESIVEPGPGDVEETTTTVAEDNDDDGDDQGDVVTGGDDEDVESPTTTEAPSDGAGGTDGAGSDGVSTTTVVIDQDSENASAYTELAASGLVLTLSEQGCADTTADELIEDGADSVDAVISAVQDCASPQAIDAFASGLIRAGGQPLPPTESACVSSRLQSADEYRPFWVALLEEEPFDFLLASTEVQNRYLDLYAECVSVGRAVSEQANVEFSPPSVGCIDDLYRDREFVRVTIEADLSGDTDERERIDGQISSCLSSDERAALADA